MGLFPAYPLNIRLPLVHTLQSLYLKSSTASWMLGRTFEALEECNLVFPKVGSEHKGLQVDLPACTELIWVSSPDIFYDIFCPNVLTVLQYLPQNNVPSFEVSPNLFSCSSLQILEIGIRSYSGLGSLIQLIFCDPWKQGVWKNINNVKMGVYCKLNGGRELFNEMVGRQQHYEAKGWRKFMVYRTSNYSIIELEALMWTVLYEIGQVLSMSFSCNTIFQYLFVFIQVWYPTVHPTSSWTCSLLEPCIYLLRKRCSKDITYDSESAFCSQTLLQTRWIAEGTVRPSAGGCRCVYGHCQFLQCAGRTKSLRVGDEDMSRDIVSQDMMQWDLWATLFMTWQCHIGATKGAHAVNAHS